MHPIDPASLQQFHHASAEQRQRVRVKQECVSPSSHRQTQETRPPRRAADIPPPPPPPSSRQQWDQTVSPIAAAAAGTVPPPSAPRRRVYRNEEVLLFRTPSDASHLVVFNLPTRPFVHPYYDLRTVAKARAEANEALRVEKEGSAAAPPSTDTGTAPAAEANGTPTPIALPPVPPPPPRPAVATGPGFVSASLSAANLCAAYHALHLLNMERVLHALSKKYGLVHELSLQCKSREVDPTTQSTFQRRAALFSSNPAMVAAVEDDEPEATFPFVEEFESGFNLWAYVKYYSVLHAAVALKELSHTRLIPGQRLKAQFIKRNTHSPSKNTPPNPTNETSASTNAEATPSSALAVPSHGPSWYPLAHHRCLDLCNYFLGFNNWNCHIQSIRRYNHEKDEELMDDSQRESSMFIASAAANFAHSWTATVIVEMAGVPYVCSGVGHAAKGETSGDAKKRAVTNAYRQLFASLALVILHNGKVAIHLLT